MRTRAQESRASETDSSDVGKGAGVRELGWAWRGRGAGKDDGAGEEEKSLFAHEHAGRREKSEVDAERERSACLASSHFSPLTSNDARHGGLCAERDRLPKGEFDLVSHARRSASCRLHIALPRALSSYRLTRPA